MLNTELSTDEILGFLSQQAFPFYQKTLIYDSIFKIPVGIFSPLEKKDKKLQKGNFNPLINQPIFNYICLLEVITLKKDIFLVKEINLNNSHSFIIKNIEHCSFLELKQKIEKLQNIGMYVSLLFSKKEFKFKSSYLSTPFVLLENFSFPLNLNPVTIKSMAIIYEPGLPQAYDEALNIYNTVQKNFNHIKLAIYSLPMKVKQFEDIFNQYNIIHYAGHMTPQGFLIQDKIAIIPTIITPPYFVFLNGCKTPYTLINHLATFHITSLFSSQDQIDAFVSQEAIKYFYLALLSGYRIGDLLSIFYTHYFRLLGWHHFNIRGKLYAV